MRFHGIVWRQKSLGTLSVFRDYMSRCCVIVWNMCSLEYIWLAHFHDLASNPLSAFGYHCWEFRGERCEVGVRGGRWEVKRRGVRVERWEVRREGWEVRGERWELRGDMWEVRGERLMLAKLWYHAPWCSRINSTRLKCTYIYCCYSMPGSLELEAMPNGVWEVLKYSGVIFLAFSSWLG